MRRKSIMEIARSNGQETYLERQMFTQLKYQLKNSEIVEKQKNRMKIAKVENLQFADNRRFETEKIQKSQFDY